MTQEASWFTLVCRHIQRAVQQGSVHIEHIEFLVGQTLFIFHSIESNQYATVIGIQFATTADYAFNSNTATNRVLKHNRRIHAV